MKEIILMLLLILFIWLVNNDRKLVFETINENSSVKQTREI
jgi:hypothetical protein